MLKLTGPSLLYTVWIKKLEKRPQMDFAATLTPADQRHVPPLQIYEYQGCQAAQDLLRGQEGETLLTANDQRSLNIRGRLFERFFSLLHVTNVASNGEHLNRECSLFTDDCRYVIVGSAVYVPEEPPPYFFEVTTATRRSVKRAAVRMFWGSLRI